MHGPAVLKVSVIANKLSVYCKKEHAYWCAALVRAEGSCSKSVQDPARGFAVAVGVVGAGHLIRTNGRRGVPPRGY
jgi:hypothetical protein